MTRAEQMQAALNFEKMTMEEIRAEAQEIGHEYDDNCFELADGSVIVFNEGFVSVYGCKE